MKKILLVVAMVMTLVSAWAIPAHKGAIQVLQPDGTSLTIQLNGDEFYSFVTTSDGYTVLLTTQGTYEYARRDGQCLVATGVIAHDPQHRSASEVAMLQGMTKRMTDREAVDRSKKARAQRDIQPSRIQRYDYTKFKGLIILIEFTDIQFSMSDPVDFYDHMVNDERFTGYVDDNGQQVNCTGSVRDYFDDQSCGRFKPHFDIVGPVKVNYKSTVVNNNTSAVFRSALSLANSSVDYSQYDTDNNGVVDMVFFQCAGMSSSFSGNNSGLLWPHRSRLYNAVFDGKSFSDYACSTELYGWESTPSSITIEGIGTFCHEFSHVLGFPDFYDADYEQSGGESHHPGEWDLMAGGGGHNYARTPCGYSLFERYSLGWANPVVIDNDGTFSMQPVHVGNTGFIIKTPETNEYFILENRQREGWDYYLPGHGMLVCRVDSSNWNVWLNNKVNNNPSHNYYELLRAGGSTSGDLPSDPFPGTANVTLISSETSPNLTTWTGKPNVFMIHSIAEDDGIISFDVMYEDEVENIIEDFETMPVTTSTNQANVDGRFAKWTFVKANVMAPTEEGAANGENAVGILSGGALTMASSLEKEAYMVKLHMNNPTTTSPKVKLSFSEDDGASWTALADVKTVPSKTSIDLIWSVKTNQPVRYRVNLSGGSSTKKCYIDDFAIYIKGDLQPSIIGDVNGDGDVDVSDVNAIINMMLGKAEAISAGDVNGDGEIDVSDVNAVINIMLGKA